jgi:hypothetical protein
MAYGMDFFSSLFSGDFAQAGNIFSSGLSDVTSFFDGMDAPVVGPGAASPSTSLWPADAVNASMSAATPDNYVEMANLGQAVDVASQAKDAAGGFSIEGMLSNPTVVTGLLTSGAGLVSNIMGQSAADDRAKESREENQLNRDFQAQQAEMAMEQRNREIAVQAEQASAARKFQAEQAEQARRFNALMNLQAGRRSLMQSKAQGAASSRSGNTTAPILSGLK